MSGNGDPATGRMVREGGQKMVAATFRHDTSHNLDPQLHGVSPCGRTVSGDHRNWPIPGQIGKLTNA